MALLFVVLGLPGYRLLGFLGPRDVGPELAVAAAFGLGLATISIGAWLAYVSGAGMGGAIAVSLVALAALGVAGVAGRVPWPRIGSSPAAWWSFALAVLVGVLAAISGPWLSHTADSFYHLAAAWSLLNTGQALPKEIFFASSVPLPDATSGTLNLVFAWLSLPGGMFAGLDAMTVFGAVLAVLAFIALALELTRSRLAALGAGGLYLVYDAHLDMRIAGYPNRIGPALVWLAVAFAVRYVRGGARRELVIAGAMTFAAGAVHPGMPPFVIALAGAWLGASAVGALLARRAAAFTSVLPAALVLILVSAPLLAIKLAAIPAPDPVTGSFATDPPDLTLWAPPWHLPAIDLHFWFDSKFSIPVLATLLLLAAPLRELRRGDAGAAVLWGASLVVPLVAVLPFVANRPQDFAYLARIADLLKPFLHIVLAWVLAEGLIAILAVLRAPPAAIQRAAVPAAAAVLIAVTALLSVGDARAAAAVYRPTGSRSIQFSRDSDLRYAWADRIQALDRAGPGVLLADVTVSYEIAGLTGRKVVAVWTSHVPFQDEARDGAMRRGDVLEAMSPTVDELTLASILERYHVAFVMLDRDVDDEATWNAAAAQPLYQRIAGGSSWALYRYVRDKLNIEAGVVPFKAIAGRAIFACCATGTDRVTARGATTGFTFSSMGPLLIPDGAPPDTYTISVGGTQAGTVTVGRAYEGEFFAGVYQERDSDKDSWHQWVSIHGDAYSRGLASYTRTAGAFASRPLDLPAGRYCLEADVVEPGDGAQRSVAIELAGQSQEISWSSSAAGMTPITREVSVPSGATTLAYRNVSPNGVQVILDRLVAWPAPCQAPALPVSG